MPSKLIFLPGASGNTDFWRPVAGLLTHTGERAHVGWPGIGPTPPDRDVNGFEDLVARVVAEIDRPCALIAQSMGGAIAMHSALERRSLITHLVLTVTSGGIDVADLGAEDWRPAFIAENPTVPRWFIDFRSDLTDRLRSITVPTLLLWGDADPISPVRVGERLAQLLPNARLHVLAGGTHDLGNALAKKIAPLIDAHLGDAARTIGAQK
jgi:pimeloyl-ACP methyl ester carboxylesterase